MGLQQSSLLEKSQNLIENLKEETNKESLCLEGFLKISPYPFPNSMKISSPNTQTPMYAQKCKNLQQEITKRKSILKHFTKNQILDFIESTIYTLVSLEQQGILYKDISSQHIFVMKEKGKPSLLQLEQPIHMKLLPNSLIEETAYQRLLRINKRVVQHQKCFTFSPQMIIALRARQKHFNDQNLVKKSNVFALGIVLLEGATLKLSHEFYDTITFDIYEQVIEKCLYDVDQRYGSVVARIIANMIDFDFSQRIQGFAELAKWIIYEIKNLESEGQIQEKNDNQSATYEQNQEISFSKGRTLPITITQRKLSHQQSIQTLPVCLQSSQTLIRQSKNYQSSQEPRKQKQNIPTQNKINIKVRQVSVYLQKNSNLQTDKQHKARLFYSPFLSTNSSEEQSQYQFRANPKMNLVKQYSKRSLAFDKPVNNHTKRSYFLQSLAPMTNYLKTHR